MARLLTTMSILAALLPAVALAQGLPPITAPAPVVVPPPPVAPAPVPSAVTPLPSPTYGVPRGVTGATSYGSGMTPTGRYRDPGLKKPRKKRRHPRVSRY